MNASSILPPTTSKLSRYARHSSRTGRASIVEANGIRQSAVQYTDDMLKSLQNILNHTLETAQAPFNSFLSAVRSSYDIVTSNRGELASGIIEPADEQTTEE